VLGQSIGSSGWQVALWSLALLVIFFPTAVYVYAKRTSD
jgi:hypothetical protein